MQLDVYQIDAFTSHIFGGNPACVVPLSEWLPDALLLQIARENAVAETAFFIQTEDTIHLRWFTPEIEMDLCGHATLATVHCLKVHLHDRRQQFRFTSLSGELVVFVEQDCYMLDFPSRKPVPSTLPDAIRRSLSIQPVEVWKARDYVLLYGQETDVRSLTIDRNIFDEINLGTGGVIVTAPGIESDFVSRFFTPQASALEDPVTGSAHCSLIPFWSERLGKTDMLALQVSQRGGTLFCSDKGDRVLIGGHARTYSTGKCMTE